VATLLAYHGCQRRFADEVEGILFQTVRGAFEEGRPLFPGSAIRTQSHIQIAVRDVQCIRIHDERRGEP
jgi:hypothetical protein